MEFKDVGELREKADQLIKAIDNQKDDSELVSQVVELLLLQDNFLSKAIIDVQKDILSCQKHHLDLLNRMKELEEMYLNENSVSELVVGD